MPFRREQVATGSDTTFASTVTATFSNTTQAGSIILVAWEGDTGAANAANTPTDSAGNTYTRVVSKSVAATFDLEIWYTKNQKNQASNAVTVTDTIGGADGILIIEEWTGGDFVTTVDSSNSNSGTGSPITPGSIVTKNPFDIIWVAAVEAVGASDLSAAGANTNLTQVATTFSNLGIASTTVAATGAFNDGFTSIVSVSWACAQVAIRKYPEGTTTSISSTSVSSTSSSISTTSSSTSSTSSSISSTSSSLSTSSTSSSVSSTSSSISSTSSSTSSTSTSSTSSSTSVSSTSSSISSTSFSSTSLSSTSSSSSISSTSSSFSSTSSSISSTSASTSSTSASSTSSSSSTSTTTLPPPYNTYSYKDVGNIVSTTLTSGSVSGSNTVFTTASITPSPNTLIIVWLASNANNGAALPSVVGNGITYTNFVTQGNVLGSSPASGFRGMSIAPTQGTITITFAVAVTYCSWIITQHTNTDTSGTNGSGAIVQSAGTTVISSSTGVILNLNTFSSVTNATAAFVRASINDTLTPSSSMTVTGRNTLPASNTTVTAAFSGYNVPSVVFSWNLATNNVSYVGAELKALVGADANNLTQFNSSQYGNVSLDDGDYFIETGVKYLIREYKSQHPNNIDIITFIWKGRSTLSSQISPIFIQIYNVSTAAWETLARETRVAADTDFQASVSQSTNVANYYDTRNIVTFRSYQQVN